MVQPADIVLPIENAVLRNGINLERESQCTETAIEWLGNHNLTLVTLF